MAIPTEIERMIWCEGARSHTAQLGGGAISSIGIPEGQMMIVWGIQIFPFFDMNNDLNEGLINQWEKVARCVHYFEFQADQRRQGVIHRSTFRMEPAGEAGPESPVPISGPDFYPVYWVFRKSPMTMRVMRPEQPSQKAPVVTVPPAEEASAVLGYPPGYAVVTQMAGYGGTLIWVPDVNQTPAVNRVNQPRPLPDPAVTTGLITPATNQVVQAPYTYPLVNINYVLTDAKGDL